MSERLQNILTGLVATVLSLSVITFGIMAATGALRADYKVSGLFSSAGQGLLPGSDVKMRGVNIGEVSSIELEGGRARITLSIDGGEDIPRGSSATIRAKTLFGEKFVDIEAPAGERHHAYLEPGDEIEDTVGAFELQQVLNEAFPIIDEIDPAELAVVLSTLAEGGRSLGPEINRQIDRFADILDVNARHDDDTDQFLRDFAALSETLADGADDLVAGATDLNLVLPDLNASEDELAVLLEQTSRLAADVADILDANRSFIETNIVEGGKALQVLADNHEEIGPLVTGLRQFFQTLAEAIRIPLADGTRLAAVKFIAGGGNPFGQDGLNPQAPELPTDPDTTSGPLPGLLPDLRSGADAITDLLGSVLR